MRTDQYEKINSGVSTEKLHKTVNWKGLNSLSNLYKTFIVTPKNGEGRALQNLTFMSYINK